MNLFGKRIELYDIVSITEDGLEGSLFSITSNSRTINATVGANRNLNFAPSTVTRSAINLKTALEKQTVTITVSSKEDIAKHFLGTTLEQPYYLRIYDWNGIDPSFSWRGRLTGVKDSGGKTQMVFEASTTQMQQIGLYRKASRMCPFVVYDTNTCMANPDKNSAVLNIVSTDGQVIVFTKESGLLTIDEGILAGGYIEIIKKGVRIKRFIETNSLTTITLFSPMVDLVSDIGSTLTVYRGCDKSPKTCNNVFNNLENFGGMPFMPTDSPFDGVMT